MNGDEPIPPMVKAEAPKPSVPVAMTDPTEMLFRQVHPTLFDGDDPASSAFMPSASDEGQLSVDRETVTTVQAAYELYMSNGLKSGGAYGITVAEFGAEDLPCYPDPLEASGDLQANPAHSRVDYSAMGNSNRRTVARRLKRCAVNRGILHKP